MTAPRTILLSSAGRRGQLVECFRDAARRLNVQLRILATDVRPELSAACQLADLAVAVPRCTAPDFTPVLLEICRREQVALVIPTIDTELLVLSEHRAEFAAIGTEIAVSAPEVVQLARDKLATAHRLSTAGIGTPRTLTLADCRSNPAAIPWPAIAKPIGGSSSIGLMRANSIDELAGLDADDYIVQELASGLEYTVNVFFDRAGQLKAAVPHWRIETRGGEVAKGRTVRSNVLEAAAHKLAACLVGARGALCFQAMVTPAGECAVFEINARFGGGYPLAHQAGARFAQWLLEEMLDRPSSATNEWQAGLTMLRYDSAVFLS